MGISVKPSFKRHHGYRTRDRPPTRHAHRSDGLATCDPLQSRYRRSTPIKKPAAANAAGFDHGRFLFPRGMRCRRPPFDAAGGGACDAAGDRVLFSHSLLQGTSAWAKPNHGFSDCQQPVAIFFRGAFASVATRRGATARARRSTHARRMRAPARMRACKCKNTGKKAVFAKRRIRGRMRSHRIARCRPTAREHSDKHAAARATPRERRRLCASHKPVCAKLRELFSRDARRRRIARGRSRLPETKNPRCSPRVRVTHAAVENRVSGLRLPAVRRSRPDPAVR